MNRIISALVIIACLLAGSTAQAFSFVAKFNSSYTYTNTNVRMSLNQASISMATSVANGVTLSVITSVGTTNNFYSTTSSIFALTLWPPNGVSTSVYLYAGDKLRATSSATNDCWLTVIYSGLDVERIDGTSNIIANTIGAASMATDSVPTYALQAGSVTQTKLATNSVNGGANVENYSLGSADYATNSVGSAAIADVVTASNCVNCTVWFDADGRATQFQSTASSAIGTQGLSSVVGISPNAAGGNATNFGTVQATNLDGALDGSDIVAASLPITALQTNYLKLARIVGYNSQAGAAAGLSAGGARVQMVTTTQVSRSTIINLWGFLTTTNSGVSNHGNQIRVTAQISTNGTVWADADTDTADEYNIGGYGGSRPFKLCFPIGAGMYYQVFCSAANQLTNHTAWTNTFQINQATSD